MADVNQGQTIQFTIDFTSSDNPSIQGFYDCDEVIAHIYTSSFRIVKFTSLTRDGYNSFTSVTDTLIAGEISSDESKIMPSGEIKIEFLCIKDDYADIGRVSTGLHLLDSTVKTAL